MKKIITIVSDGKTIGAVDLILIIGTRVIKIVTKGRNKRRSNFKISETGDFLKISLMDKNIESL